MHKLKIDEAVVTKVDLRELHERSRGRLNVLHINLVSSHLYVGNPESSITIFKQTKLQTRELSTNVLLLLNFYARRPKLLSESPTNGYFYCYT